MNRAELIRVLQSKPILPGGFAESPHVVISENELREVIRLLKRKPTERTVPIEATR